jgi:superfamily II DNA or RNA helicase
MADIPEWLTYEHQAIEQHAETYPDAEVHHWSRIPETMLTDAGYIHAANQWRLDRKRRFNPDEASPNPVSDYGLDGLARIAPDEYHGIQAKRRKTGSYLRAADLGSFMAVVQRMRVKHPDSRGFLYTDSKLTRELSDDLALVPGYEVVHMQLAIAAAAVEAPVAPAAALELWPHQLEAITALQAWDEPRGVFIMPPGSGKTMVMGIWGRESARVVVCSPTRALAVQTLEAMGRLMPNHRRLLVDSDSAGTRDTAAIAAAWADDTPLLVSTTYASMCDVVAGVVTSDAVVMVDEGHHIAGNVQLRMATESLKCRMLIVTGTPPDVLLNEEDDEAVLIIYQYHYDRAVNDGRICDYRIYVPLIVDPVGDLDHDTLVIALGADIVSRCHFLANGMLRTGSTRCIVYAGSVEEAEAYQVALPRLAAQFHGIAAWAGLVTGDTPVIQRNGQIAVFQAYDPMFRWFFLCSVRVLDEGIDIPACDAVYIANSIGNQLRFVQRMCRANRVDYPGKVASVFVWSDDADIDETLRATARVATALSRTGQSARAACVSTDYARAVEPAVDAALMERVRVMCVPVTERWHTRLARADAFMMSSKKRPSAVSSDPDEKQLGMWIRNQMASYHADGPSASKNIMKTNTDIHTAWTLLLQRHVALFDTAEGWWRRSAAEAEALMNRSKRRPMASSNNPDEKRLGNWIVVQMRNYNADGPVASKYIMQHAEVHSEWTSLLTRHMMLFMTAEESWYRSATEAGEWMTSSEKRPSATSSDPDEKRLGAWVSNQMTKYSADGPASSTKIMRNVEIHAAWTLLMKRHTLLFMTAEESWHRSATEAEKWMTLSKQRPRNKSSDLDEQRLGRWIATQMASYSVDGPTASEHIMKNTKVHSAWTAFMKRNTRLLETAEESWHRSAIEAEAFMTSSKKRPSARSNNPDEKRLGTWIANQFGSYHADGPVASKRIMKNIEVHLAWTSLMKRHVRLLETAEESWKRSAAEAEAFMAASKKRPSAASNDPDEKRLGVWITNQTVKYSADGPSSSKANMKNTEVHAAWTSFIKRHVRLLETAEESWTRSATEAEAFMAASKKRPSATSNDPDEKRLGVWITNQTVKYSADGPSSSKAIMTHTEVHAAWTELLKRHATLMTRGRWPSHC